MTNYRLYFKLLKKHIPQGMIYLFFFGLILLTNLYPMDTDIANQYQIYIVGNEKSTICQEIKTYLEETRQAKVSFWEDEDENKSEKARDNQLKRLINEAVLTDVVNCVIKVSEEDGTDIEVITNQNDAASRDIESAIQGALLKKDSEIEKESTVIGTEIGEKNHYIRKYLNITIYGLSTLICVGIISVAASMNKQQIKERRSYAPLEDNTEIDLLKCHFLLGLIVSVALFLPVYWVDIHMLFSIKGFLLGVNILLVAGNLVMIGYLLSIFVRNLNLEMAAVNVVSLGTLFMSGTLQEQWCISKLAARIGSFIPTYWYVKANNLITMKNFNERADHKEILETMMIEGLFFIAFYIIGLVTRMQRIEEEEK